LEEPVNSFVIGMHLVVVVFIVNIIIKEDNQNIVIIKEDTTVVVKVGTKVIEGGINCSFGIFNINIYSNNIEYMQTE